MPRPPSCRHSRARIVFGLTLLIVVCLSSSARAQPENVQTKHHYLSIQVDLAQTETATLTDTATVSEGVTATETATIAEEAMAAPPDEAVLEQPADEAVLEQPADEGPPVRRPVVPEMVYEEAEEYEEPPTPEEQADDDTLSLDLYGMVMFGYSIRPWRNTPGQRYGNLVFNQFRLSFDAKWRGFTAFYEMRFWDFMILVRQAWLQYAWGENQIRLGLIQRPWGRDPFSSESWWFALDWYVGLGDDYDLGMRYRRDTKHYLLDLAYMVADADGFLDPTHRWGADLTPIGEQQNTQFSTLAGRAILKLQHGDDAKTDVGVFGSVGLIENGVTGDLGYRWYAGATYTGNYDGWIPLLQFTRQEFHANNPAEVDGVVVDDRVVRISQFAVVRDMAAKGWMFNVNLAKQIDLDGKWVQALVPYINYSSLIKDVDEFKDTHLFTPGLQIRMYSLWIWFDFVIARNVTFMNDSASASGIGAGAIRPDRYEIRPNVQAIFYF